MEAPLHGGADLWDARAMAEPEGRAPRPPGGDPNARATTLSLTAEEWRRLRAWAAEDATTVEAIVGEIVRDALAARPRVGF